jgi:hypothetical protein
MAPREREVMSITNTAVIARLDRATQYSRDVDDKAEKPRRTGTPACAGDDESWLGQAVRRPIVLTPPQFPQACLAGREAAKLQHLPQFAANRAAWSVTSGDIHDILIAGLISEGDFCSKWFGSQRKWTLRCRKFDANVCGSAAARVPR